MTVFEVLGVDHSWTELVVFGVGWTLGWLLLWRPLTLPSERVSGEGVHGLSSVDGGRPAVAVVIPARNEASSLPHLLRPLVEQRRDGDEILVVDDHSDDGTARVAEAFGVDVIQAPALPDGWLGKPHACWRGAAATSAPVLVFLDADVRPGVDLLDGLAHEVHRHPESLVSMQPWHHMETAGEQPSILFNVTALMGCGAFTVLPRSTAADVAFGPVVAVDRATYDRAGGHAADGVRARHTEDIGLARAIGSSRLFVGTPATTSFRMYPGGLPDLASGWGRSIATGSRSTRWWLALATAAWIWSLAGGFVTAPLVYPLSALQVGVLGRRAGTTDPRAAALYPLLVVVFVAVFVRSLLAVVTGRGVTWKGRRIDARAG